MFNVKVANLIHKNTVPPGGFRYRQPETNLLIEAPSYEDLIMAVKKHRQANSIPIGVNFNNEIEDALCREMPIGICNQHVESRMAGFTLAQFKQGSQTLADWFVVGGRKKVEPAEAARRAKICVGCPHNQKPVDCARCMFESTVRALVDWVVGSDKVQGDEQLYGCAVCGCSNKSAIWIPIEVLQRNTPEDVNAKLENFCWKKKQ